MYYNNTDTIIELETPVYHLDKLPPLAKINGPCIILNETSTIVVEPNCIVNIT